MSERVKLWIGWVAFFIALVCIGVIVYQEMAAIPENADLLNALKVVW